MEEIVCLDVSTTRVGDATTGIRDASTSARYVMFDVLGDGGVGLGIEIGRIGLSCTRIVLGLFHQFQTYFKGLDECSHAREDDGKYGRGLELRGL